MDEFTPLALPPQPQVSIDPNRRDCPSDGFNYPTFRLVNKQTRIYLSQPLNLDPSISYHPFAVANTKGWFAAIRKIGDIQDIIFSPLEALRDSLKNAKESEKGLFVPKRDLSVKQGRPIIVAFAHNDTRLVVGLDQGSLLVFDTPSLFSSGSESVPPLYTCASQLGMPRQIIPNPGVEPELVNLVAVVWSGGRVQLLNTRLESQGGWSAADPNASPVAVSWSPKGKHLAIGLKTGDILTFALNNKLTPNKHIPPAAEGLLVAIDWLSPGHSFRLSYAPQIANEGEPIQQIVSLDTKSNSLIIFNALHPFTMPDRRQRSHALILPHWDEDSVSENSKSLIVVGDEASTDIEILGGSAREWHQQSQENPLSLPLDQQTEETTLLTLDVDLTDTNTSAPLVYAYLNDGSLQGWHAEHSKPYLKIVSPVAGVSGTSTKDTPQDSAMNESSSAFGAPSQLSSFGQVSAFGSLSSGTSAFGTSGFGQPSAFGALKPATPAFGSTAFGGATGGAFGGFGSMSSSSNVFGQPSFGVSNTSALAPPTQPPTAPDEITREASMSDGTAPSFGGLSLGEGNDSVKDEPKSSIFGTVPSTTQTPITSSFGGGLIKPATGFGTYNNFGSSSSAPTFNSTKPAAPASSTVLQPTPNPAFGQTAFGQSSFGQSSFGQPSFGQSSFGKPGPSSTSTVPNTGGFAAFASSSPSSFGSAIPANKTATAPSTGGFSAFASGGLSSFGAAAPKQDQPQAPSGPSPFASKPVPEGSPFASDNGGLSPFGTSAFGGSNFGHDSLNSGLGTTSTSIPTPKPSPIKHSGIAMSPPSSPEPTKPSSPFAANESPSPDSKKSTTPTTGIFATSSAFRPATGFGAFGSAQPSSSPFFKKPEDKTPPVTAFSAVNPSSVFKPLSAATPTFGAPSQLGATHKSSTFSTTAPTASSAFTTPTTTPTKPPASGGFSGFSGSSSPFSALTGPKTSFSDLLKGSDRDNKEPEKGKASPGTVLSKEAEGSGEPATPNRPSVSVSAFDLSTPTPTKGPTESATVAPETPTPTLAATREVKEESITPKGTSGDEVSEPSLSNISLSSGGSSFVDVSAEKPFGEGSREENDDDGDDAHSFLSEDFESEPPTDEESSDEDDQLEHDEKDTAATPTSSKLRSPSSTPQPEVPFIQVTSSLIPSEGSDAVKAVLPSVKEESTTPPGSPSKEARSTPSKSPSPTPFPATSPPTPPGPPSFGIGLGRPSTRPTRSSPLAAAPVSGDDDDEEGEKKAEEISEPLASPRPLASLPSLVKEEAVKQEQLEAAKSAGIKRPQTPPLLSSLGAPGSFKLAPIAPNLEPASVFPTKSPFVHSSPSPPTSSHQGSPATAPPDLPTKLNNTTLAKTKLESDRPATAPPFPNTFARPSTPPQSLTSTSVPITPAASFPLPAFSLTPKPTGVSQGNQPASGLFSPLSEPVGLPSSSHTAPGLFSPAPDTTDGPQAGQSMASFFGGKFPPVPLGGQAGSSPVGSQATSSLFGAAKTAPGPTFVKSPAPPIPPPPPKPSLEEGMQKECALLVTSLNKELEELRLLAEEANKKRSELSRSAGGSRRKEDLGDPSKWGLCDTTCFGQTLLQFEGNLAESRNAMELSKQGLRELKSNLLKASTRREEIARFNKAKTDKEFAKMLTTRSLGPEHLETRQQLRHSIRMMQDRVQKLESHLRASKKKLSQAASGKPSIRAPTLDIINRTYRNVDLAIQQQTDEVAKLCDRMAKLQVMSIASASPSRDSRLPDQRRRALAVTPHVAVTTAAALNAERSAQKLKKALLAARKEPILNQNAASAPPPPAAFKTPQKLPTESSIFPASEPLFSATTSGEFETPPPAMNWAFPDDHFSPGSPLPSSRRGASSSTKKHGSVPLKKTPGGPTQTPPASTFDWGPLPTFNNSPLTQLAAEVKPMAPFVPLTATAPPTPTPGSNPPPPNISLGKGWRGFGTMSS